MSNLPTLYYLDSQWDELMELAEIDPDVDLDDTIEGLEGTMEVKRQAVGYYLENLKATAKARREAAARMEESADAMEARHKRLTDYLIHNMKKHGILEVSCPQWTMKLQQNPPKVVIDDASKIPLKLQREIPAKYEPDKKAIKSEISAGNTVDGAHLERGWRLKVT